MNNLTHRNLPLATARLNRALNAPRTELQYSLNLERIAVVVVFFQVYLSGFRWFPCVLFIASLPVHAVHTKYLPYDIHYQAPLVVTVYGNNHAIRLSSPFTYNQHTESFLVRLFLYCIIALSISLRYLKNLKKSMLYAWASSILKPGRK